MSDYEQGIADGCKDGEFLAHHASTDETEAQIYLEVKARYESALYNHPQSDYARGYLEGINKQAEQTPPPLGIGHLV